MIYQILIDGIQIHPADGESLSGCRRILAQRGWSLRTAAPLLGVHFGHLQKVLTGQRESHSLLRRIEHLPSKSNP